MGCTDRSEISDYVDAYENGVCIPKVNRGIVHDRGLCHYAIHCWVFARINNKLVVLFQKRRTDKRLFPGKYDIAAAGHYLSGEYGTDGLRELVEELGRPIDKYKINYYSQIDVHYKDDSINNNEICNVFLCRYLEDVATLHFDKSEIADLVYVDIDAALKVIQGTIESASVFSIRDNVFRKAYTKEFIPEYKEYFFSLLNKVKENEMLLDLERARYYTFIMLKPDAIKRDMVDNIVSFFVERGFRIEYFNVQIATDEKVNAHYADKIAEEGDIYKDKAKVYFHDNYVIPMIISHEGDDIIRYVRELVGYKDPQYADKSTIRGRWGIDSMEVSEREVRCCENLIHASDSVESFKREAVIWFQRDKIERFLC